MSIDLTDMDPRVDYQTTPCWAVGCTRTGKLISWSESMGNEVDYSGYDTMDLLEVPFPENPTLIMVFEGSFRAIPIGSYDGPEGGPEYDLEYTGSWRPLTEDEAAALVQGNFEPGIDMLDQPNSFARHIHGQFRAIIDAHGPITRANISSAAKRLVGAVRDWSNKQRAKRLGEPPT
jgi:hypothetical protein